MNSNNNSTSNGVATPRFFLKNMNSNNNSTSNAAATGGDNDDDAEILLSTTAAATAAATATEEEDDDDEPSTLSLFDDNIFSTVFKFVNVLDLIQMKNECVSKGYNDLITHAIKDKCKDSRRERFFQTRELHSAVVKYFNIKYEPESYEGDEQQRRDDAEEIACSYGWDFDDNLSAWFILRERCFH